VSRVNIEQKTIQFLKQYTGGVSKAVWPSSIRRCVATGKGRRRIMILKRFLLLHRLRTPYFLHTFNKMQVFSKHLLATCSCTIHIIIVVVAGDIIEMLCMFYNWPIQQLLAIICTTTTLIVVHLASSNMQRKREYSYLFKNKLIIGLRREERRLIESRLADSALVSTPYIGHEDEEYEHQPVLIPFSDIPMPTTPLIRVMETINLSSSELEYFPALQDISIAKPALQDVSVVKPAREDHCQRIDMSPQE